MTYIGGPEHNPHKAVADDIHEHAGVPEKLNPDIFAMTVAMLEKAVDHWEAIGLSLNEQKRELDKKKDYLINELKDLARRGVVRTGEEGQPMAPPAKVHMSQINIKRPQ